MISNTIYSKGRDNFKGYTFSAREWSAPTMVSPKEIRERIDSFALCGRKIKRMRLIGLSYFHTRRSSLSTGRAPARRRAPAQIQLFND